MTSPTVAAAATPRVTFHTCLHDDGDAMWLQFEGGTGGVAPEMLRLVRDGEVLETRPCIPMPAGRKSHARPDGDSTVWVVLRVPEDMVRAIEADERRNYGADALVDGTWIPVDVQDSGCRFGMKQPRSRSA